MIRDIDLDVKNYSEGMVNSEALVYLHAYNEDEDVIEVVNGQPEDIVDMLIMQEEIHDLIVLAAAHIVVENNINFKGIVDEIKKD